jgi:hypothetical protein
MLLRACACFSHAVACMLLCDYARCSAVVERLHLLLHACACTWMWGPPLYEWTSSTYARFPSLANENTCNMKHLLQNMS